MNQRLEYLDNAKSIGIILMIIGHCYWKESIPYLNQLIYSFHMALFFIISGCFNRPMTFLCSIKKYSKSYLVPYLIGFVLSLLSDLIKGNEFGISLIYKLIFASGSTNSVGLFHDMPPIGAVWFLFALFCSSCMFSYLQTKFDRVKILFPIIILFLISFLLFKHVRLPFSILQGFVALPFLYIGKILKEYRIIEKTSSCLYMFLSFIIWLPCALFAFTSFNLCDFGTYNLGVFSSIFGSILLLMILSRCNFKSLWIGKNTLFILLANSFIINFNSEIYSNLPFQSYFNFAIEVIISVSLSIIMGYILSKVIRFII